MRTATLHNNSEKNELVESLNIACLPMDIILIHLFPLFPIEFLIILTRVSKSYYRLIKNQSSDSPFWKELSETQFPHVKLKKFNYTEFFNTYRRQYDPIHPLYFCKPVRDSFTFLKAGDVTNLKKVLTLDTFEYLFRKDSDGNTLLQWARYYNNQIVLDYIYQLATEFFSNKNINTIDPWYGSILHWAIICNQSLESITNLVSEGADVNGCMTEERTGHHSFKLISRTWKSPLYEAVISKRSDIVKFLLANKAEVGYWGSPLLAAIDMKNIDIVSCLLTSRGKSIDSMHYTKALQKAAYNGCLEIVDELIKHGANINKSNFWTPLHSAILGNELLVVRYLLENGADIDAIYHDPDSGCQFTPIALAKKIKNIDIITSIIKKALSHFIEKIGEKEDAYRNRFLGFFEYGYTAKQLKEAAEALQAVVIGAENFNILNSHFSVLNNDEKLKEIYDGLQLIVNVVKSPGSKKKPRVKPE